MSEPAADRSGAELRPGWIPLRRPSDLARDLGPRRPEQGDGPAALEWPAGFVSNPDDRSALHVLLGMAALTARRLLELSGGRRPAAECLAMVMAGEAGSDGDRRFARSVDATTLQGAAEASGMRLVPVHDPEYPPDLLDLFDPPAGVFVTGETLATDAPRVAVVGARNCSASGREAASALARALASVGAEVVSGGARGIDEAAHRGALAGGGRTIAVLGCGLDVPYPKSNARLFDSIREGGTLVSEYPPGTRAEPFRFPARNRIVSALSRAVVVVEGAEGSGSMITAEQAMEIGREVFGVPGPVTSPLSWVPHTLIRDGATLVRGVDDLVQDLGLGGPAARPEGAGSGAPAPTSPLEAAVWEALTGPSTSDAVARTVGRELPDVLEVLVALEIRGVVRQVGGRYQRRFPG